MNLVVLKGNLVSDPQRNSLPSGDSVVTFDVAVNDVYTDRQGNQQKITDYFECKAYGPMADNINKFFSKGRAIIIEGCLKQEKWTDKQSQQNRSKVVVRIKNWEFGDSKPANSNKNSNKNSNYTNQNNKSNENQYDLEESDSLEINGLTV